MISPNFTKHLLSALVCVFAMCSVNPVFSQNIDSLFNVANSMGNSISKAEMLIEISEAQNNIGLYKKGVSTAKEAIEICVNLLEKEAEAKARLALSDCYMTDKKFDMAEQVLEETMLIYKNLNLEGDVADVNSKYGELFAWKSSSDEDNLKAKEYLLEAISYRLENNEYSSLATDYFELAVVYNNSNNAAKTLEYYYKAIEIIRDPRYSAITNGSNRLAAGYANIGLVYKDAYENNLAIEYYLKALNSLPKNGNVSNRSIMNYQLSVLHMRNGNFSNSFNYIYKSLKLGEDINNNYRIKDGYEQLGLLHFEKAELDSAYYYFNKAFEISTETKDERESIHHSLGNYYLKIGDIDEALNQFEKSIKYDYSFWSSYKGLANCYKMKGDFESSVSYLETSHHIKDSLEELRGIPAVNLSETVQEQKLATKEKTRIEKEQKEIIQERNYLQYSGVLLVIVILLLILNLIVSIKLPPIAIKALSFITVLTLFEFTLVYLDPYIEYFTNSEPVEKLSINVLIAVLIFPLHNFIEKKLFKKVAEK
jgi:tetratricopeptide (TPR) repeat protein